MATLLESPPNPISLADVAQISQQLADELGRMVLKTEGFSVADYLSLNGNYFVEYDNGRLQVLPMPDSLHQAIILIVANLFIAYSKQDAAARTKVAPFKVWLNDRKYREPDVCFMKGEHADRRFKDHWMGADLVVEIISESNRDHDEQTKRREYAEAGIPEYWIIDPEGRVVEVLALAGNSYISKGVFGAGMTALSATLAGFAVDVDELFKLAEAQA